MATGYEFLMSDFGNWQPTVPETNDFTPTQPGALNFADWTTLTPNPFTSLPVDATDQNSIDYWGAEGGAAAQNWASAVIPLMQLLSNNFQSGRDFTEAQDRFWQQFGWGQQRDQFNMDLASRQQSSQEQQALWQQGNFQDQLEAQALNDAVSRDVANREMSLAELTQQEQANQWEQSFAAQQINDRHARRIANQRIALEEEVAGRELDLNERRQIWEEEYGRARLENEAEAARFSAFGRNQAPSGAWVANWG